jgi:hypothetical protein
MPWPKLQVLVIALNAAVAVLGTLLSLLGLLWLPEAWDRRLVEPEDLVIGVPVVIGCTWVGMAAAITAWALTTPSRRWRRLATVGSIVSLAFITSLLAAEGPSALMTSIALALAVFYVSTLAFLNHPSPGTPA